MGESSGEPGSRPLAAAVAAGRAPVPGVVHTPWTASQVDSLNGYQASGFGHPYTCPDRAVDTHVDGPYDRGVLAATAAGWVCVDCGYTQGWAHQWAADGTWRKLGGSWMEDGDGGPAD